MILINGKEEKKEKAISGNRAVRAPLAATLSLMSDHGAQLRAYDGRIS